MTPDCDQHRLTAADHRIVGCDVDAQTRCVHYHTDRDVIAIKFACCETYYPCFQCHDACADHDAERWAPEQFDEPAVLCGVCGAELTIQQYLDCDNECPNCEAAFNPGCRDHLERYVAVEKSE